MGLGCSPNSQGVFIYILVTHAEVCPSLLAESRSLWVSCPLQGERPVCPLVQFNTLPQHLEDCPEVE